VTVRTIIQAMDHPKFFRPLFRGESWNGWRAPAHQVQKQSAINPCAGVVEVESPPLTSRAGPFRGQYHWRSQRGPNRKNHIVAPFNVRSNSRLWLHSCVW
jgi:hypothetical protein